MNLEISSFADAGDAGKERLVLRVVNDTDIGEYAVFYSAIGADGFPNSGEKTPTFWFPDGKVKAGDLVVLYTKQGTASTKSIGKDNTAHFHYWGQQKAIWGDPQFGAIVLHVSEWTYAKSSASSHA